jgi:hypothetical protein
MSVIPSVRTSEYTGENRCVPCTLANAAIALVLAAARKLPEWLDR